MGLSARELKQMYDFFTQKIVLFLFPCSTDNYFSSFIVILRSLLCAGFLSILPDLAGKNRTFAVFNRSDTNSFFLLKFFPFKFQF